MLLWNTMSLTVAVTMAALVIGVSLAWITQRCDIPGGRVWRVLLALPLVIPPYVGAVAYIAILGPQGWLQQWWGFSPFPVYSFSGIFFVLTIFTYPYVFLISSAALNGMNRHFEDVARSVGMGSLEVFLKINLPFLRPAIGAGGILVSLYVLSDFGAVAMLRYTTFTSAIYYQMGSYDNVSATVLSTVLIALILIIIWLERRTRGKQRYYQASRGVSKPARLNLGRWKPAATAYVCGLFFFSVILPVGVLLYWSWHGVALGALSDRFWSYASNSIAVAGLAAVLAMIISLPVVYLKARNPSIIAVAIDRLSYSGYALPGVIVALGLIFIFNRYIPWLYNTFFLISIAYVIRFLPQSMQSSEASLSLISPRIDEAARSLGYSPAKVLFRVIIPLILPGILAGGALVFVSAIKELPATLLLRPPGFDTLSVRVWVEASEAVYHMAAPAAMLIIVLSVLPLKWMLGHR